MLKGLYKIKDPFMNFWFRFVFPNEGLIQEFGEDDILTSRISPHFARYVAETSEDICLYYLKIKNAKGELPAKFENVSRWWDASVKIDIIAIFSEAMMVCECKWQENNLMGMSILQNLMEKSKNIFGTQD